jgi:uncharacterized protein YbjQ (UPF0145 family)
MMDDATARTVRGIGWLLFIGGILIVAGIGIVAFIFEQSLDRMVAEAESLGANAIVATRFTTSVMMGGAAELLAIGTAVVVEDA